MRRSSSGQPPGLGSRQPVAAFGRVAVFSPRRSAAPVAAVVAAVLIGVSGCAASSGRQGAAAPQPTVRPAAKPQTRAITKVLTFIEENHSLDEMSGGMPYTYAQAKKYGYATDYTALAHPSLPNYLGIAGGSTFGVTDDAPPASHPLDSTTVFGQAIAGGKTAKLY